MLNWIAAGSAATCSASGARCRATRATLVPSRTTSSRARSCPSFWGDPVLQGLHIGFFVAIGALVVYWMILNRTTLGYGSAPSASTPRRRATAASASRATTSWRWRSRARSPASRARSTSSAGSSASTRTTSRPRTIGFIGIAVALLGRNTAVGVFFAALLFGALVTGTSTRQPRPDRLQARARGNLTLLIQGLVVLFVGADVLILYIWHACEEAGPRGTRSRLTARGAGAPHRGLRARSRRTRHRRSACSGAAWVALPPVTPRSWTWADRRSASSRSLLGIGVAISGRAPARRRRDRRRALGIVVGVLATRPSVGHLEDVFVWSALLAADAPLRDAAHLRRARRHVLRAQRRREHRPRGDDADGRVLRHPGRRQARARGWLGLLVAIARRRAAGARCTRFFSIHLRADQIVGGTAINFLALGLTGYLFIDIYGHEGTPTDIPAIPRREHLASSATSAVPREVFGQLNLMIWLAIML